MPLLTFWLPMFLESTIFSVVIESTPLVSIDLVVKNHSREYLLGRRLNRPARGYWFVPGGRVLKNERISEAFSRVTAMELGKEFDLENADFLGTYEHFYSDSAVNDSISTHYVVLAYEIELETMELELPCQQHSSYRWVCKEELLRDKDVHSYTKNYFN